MRDAVPFQGAFTQLFTQNNAIAIAVFCLVSVALLGAMAHSWWRGRRGQGPARRAEANKLEAGYVVVLAGIVAFLVVTGFMANAKDYPDPPRPAVAVKVTGYQWCWRFAYAGTARAVTGQCQQDAPPALVVPAGELVRFDVTSADVVHAFWLPQQRFKVNAYPGHVNSFTITFPAPGQWTGRCAQLCGIYHYNMDFTLKVVPRAAFAGFLRPGAS